MSLVMAFATENFAIMSGDFRRTHIEDDKIHFDDCQKVFKINSRVLGGFTGDCDVSINLLQALKSIKDHSTVEAVARFIKKELNSIDRADLQQTVILTGISDSGKIVIFNISHHNQFKVKKIKPNSGEIKWEYAFPFVDPGPFIESLYQELEDCIPENIASLAEKVNEKASEMDIRVSKQCRIFSIVK
jgi:hypothetical protein